MTTGVVSTYVTGWLYTTGWAGAVYVTVAGVV